MVECLAAFITWSTGPDPGFSVGGGVDPFWGGFGLQCGHFSVKMYAKTKELGPVGGGRAPARPPPPPDPPMVNI